MGKLVMPRKKVTESQFISHAEKALSLSAMAVALDTEPYALKKCAERHNLQLHIAKFKKRNDGPKPKKVKGDRVICPACEREFSEKHSQRYCPECRRTEDLYPVAMGAVLCDTSWAFREEHNVPSDCISLETGENYGKSGWKRQPSDFGQIYFAAGAAARV